MTDLLTLLLGQAGQAAEESAARELNDALRARAMGADGSASAGAGAPEEAGNLPSPASLLAEEYAALRRVSAGGANLPRAGSLSRPVRDLAGAEGGILPGQRLIIKETEAGAALDPAALDRLFERDARRYDNGFTLY